MIETIIIILDIYIAKYFIINKLQTYISKFNKFLSISKVNHNYLRIFEV